MLDALAEASAKRDGIRAGGTDALRLVDGAADGLPGIEIDSFAGHWLVQTRDRDTFPPGLESANPDGAIYWKPLGDKTAPRHVAGPELREPFVAVENGLRFRIDFTSGYSQGLFIDQRDNRVHLRAACERSPGLTVLNCFAYTCAFGVAAAAGGAETVNLDLSRSHLDWGRLNYELNGLGPAIHDFIFGDVADWLRRFAKKGRRFDAIVLDPPTFSRNDRGRVFTIERGYPELIRLAAALLTPSGFLLCSSNQRSLAPAQFRALLAQGLADPSAWSFAQRPMPSDFRGTPYLKSFLLSRPS